MFNNRAQIQEALTRLGRRLALADADECSLLICGGSALSLAGLVNRATRDVDVHFRDLETIKPTIREMETAIRWLLDRKASPEFRQAVAKISKSLGFPKRKARGGKNPPT
jgi:hypothetical protein